MGCDIHFVVEKKHKNKWVGVYTTDWYFQPVGQPRNGDDKKVLLWPILKARDYGFFGRLAGVRYDGPEPNGVPNDISDLTQMCLEHWEGVGYSHCHMSVLEFCTRKAASPEETAQVTAEKLLGNTESLLARYCDMNELKEAPNMRVIAWFDN